MQFAVMTKKFRFAAWQIAAHACILPSSAVEFDRSQRSRGASATEVATHCSVRVFNDYTLTNVLTGKIVEGEERSTVTAHSNWYRCTERTAGGASGSGRASGISLSKQKCSGSEGIST